MSTLAGADDRRVLFGQQALADLPRVVQELGFQRVLLVTGRQSFTASGAAAIVPVLQEVAEVLTWSDFAPNPNVDDLIAGIRHSREFRPDGIVAIGGGSVLDMAKLLSAFIGHEPDAVRAAVRSNAVEGRSLGLILAPTTSGSGSEATHFAVAYIGEEKFSVAHPSLLPDVVVVDPELTESASAYQKATSVIDAIAQAVESYWARGATDASRSFAYDALAELVPSAAAFVGGDREASVPAARGSHLAGRAIDVSKTTGAHALAYGLTSRHGISHGHAVAVTLGAFARLHAAAASEARADPDLGRHMESIAEVIGAIDVVGVGDRLDEIARQLGLELRLEALGVPQADLTVMAGGVNVERLGNNPVELSEPELVGLLDRCWASPTS